MTSPNAPLVVGIDGHGRARDALALAARLAGPGQRVVLTHVQRQHGPRLNRMSVGEYEHLVQDAGIEHETRLTSNISPAAGLHEIAVESGASLIVVGSSRRSWLERVLGGSVAEAVVAGTPVPVAIAPHGYGIGGHRIAVIGCGFDGSPESREALTWAADFARQRRARLRVLAVATSIAFGGISTAGATGYRSANHVLRRALEHETHEAVASLTAGVEAAACVLDGDAATQLTAACVDLDLLVLGSRSRGPVRSALLGSVSRALVRSAVRPLVVLPRSAIAVTASAQPHGGSARRARAGSA
jgi:nucleotide-binding universal stress UspA family protein